MKTAKHKTQRRTRSPAERGWGAVAQFGDWTLWGRSRAVGGCWQNFKLARPQGRKRNYWLGWNGERLAKNDDTNRLTDDHPEVVELVLAWLSQHTDVTP